MDLVIQRKYATANQPFYVSLQQRDLMDYKADPTLAAGDVTIDKDGAGFASIEGAGIFGDFVSVTPAAGIQVKVTPDATALTCKKLTIKLVDQTSPKEWEDTVIIIETYGHASAQHPFDLGTASAAQTADNNTLLAATKALLDTTACAELAADPGATPAGMIKLLMLLYMKARNAETVTATAKTVKNDAGATILTHTLSDDATTFTKSKVA